MNRGKTPLWFETFRQSEIYYYDEQERLVYTRAYITHGYLEDDSEPSYCLTVDHYIVEDVCSAVFSDAVEIF